MAAMPGDPDLSKYPMYRLHIHEVHTVLMGVGPELYLEEHYRQMTRALVSLAMSSTSHIIDLETCKATAINYG